MLHNSSSILFVLLIMCLSCKTEEHNGKNYQGVIFHEEYYLSSDEVEAIDNYVETYISNISRDSASSIYFSKEDYNKVLDNCLSFNRRYIAIKGINGEKLVSVEFRDPKCFPKTGVNWKNKENTIFDGGDCILYILIELNKMKVVSWSLGSTG